MSHWELSAHVELSWPEPWQCRARAQKDLLLKDIMFLKDILGLCAERVNMAPAKRAFLLGPSWVHVHLSSKLSVYVLVGSQTESYSDMPVTNITLIM